MPHDLRRIQRLLRLPSGDVARRPVGRLPCLEGRPQGVRHRRLGQGRGTGDHLQGLGHRLSGAAGAAGPATGAVPGVPRHEVDPALRQAESVRRRPEGSSDGVPPHRLPRPDQETAAATGAQSRLMEGSKDRAWHRAGRRAQSSRTTELNASPRHGGGGRGHGKTRNNGGRGRRRLGRAAVTTRTDVQKRLKTTVESGRNRPGGRHRNDIPTWPRHEYESPPAGNRFDKESRSWWNCSTEPSRH